MHVCLTAICVLLLSINSVSCTSIVLEAQWTDTSGNPINLSGGSFIKHGHWWYWFGVEEVEDISFTREVKVYRSRDLVGWEYRRDALSLQRSGNDRSLILERPKVIYSAADNKFVMWFHLDDAAKSSGRLAVANSVDIEGPYTYLGSFQPFGRNCSGLSVFQDDDSAAYLTFTTNGNTAVIMSLAADYLTIESKVQEIKGVPWSAFSLFKRQGRYYLITTGLNSDKETENYYLSSAKVSGPWSSAQTVATRPYAMYNFHTNDVIEVTNDTLIWAARHLTGSQASDFSYYVWLPIQFTSDHQLSIRWSASWWLDAASGQHGDSLYTMFECEDSAAAVLSGGVSVMPCPQCSQGLKAGHIGLNGTLEISPIIVGETTRYSIVIGYINGDTLDRYVKVRVNGVHKLTVTFPPTGSWNKVQNLVIPLELYRGGNALIFSNPSSWGPDLDYVRVEWY